MAAAVGVGVPALVVAGPLGGAATAAPANGQVQIIQAAPGSPVNISVDGKQVRSSVAVGTVAGPFRLPVGKHEVGFTRPSGGTSMRVSVTVKAGANADVVLHRPASVGGSDVVNVYRTPRATIGPGKARVLIAHTATVAPADVRVDGTKIFTNIANGEYATADVPAGTHQVELLATGRTTDPILGPVDVTLKPRTVTMVYAVGRPKDGSMRVIAHVSQISADGSIAPTTIKTGSAGLAAGRAVSSFSPAGDAGSGTARWAPLGAGALLAVAAVATLSRGRATPRRSSR